MYTVLEQLYCMYNVQLLNVLCTVYILLGGEKESYFSLSYIQYIYCDIIQLVTAINHGRGYWRVFQKDFPY